MDKALWFHVDLKHAMWREDYLQQTGATLKGWGYNGVLLEIEDKYRFGATPSFAHADAWNRQEMQAAAADLRAQGLEVIPMLQTLAHAEYILRNDEFAHLRESPEHTSQFDPLSEESRAFVITLIDELIDVLQPTTYFHMGGDEAWSLGKSDKCKAVVETIGTGGLYMQHMLPLMEHVHKRGLRPVIWPDIVLTHPEVIEQIPDYVALMDWDYWTGGERWDSIAVWGRAQLTWQEYQNEDLPEFREHLERYAVDAQTQADGSFRAFYCMDALIDKGFDVFLAPATRSHGDTLAFPRYAIHDPNCYYAARKGMREGLGCCVTSWAVRHSHPEVNLVSAFAVSHALKQDGAYGAQDLAAAYTAARFGAPLAAFAQLQEIASLPVPFAASHTQMPDTPENVQESVRTWIAQIEAQEGGRDAEETRVCATRARLVEALALLPTLREQAQQNIRDFDFFEEGLLYLQFCADMTLSILSDTLAAKRAALLHQLQNLRKRGASLFAQTYLPHSTVEEMTRRYSFHETLLQHVEPSAR